MARFFRPSSLLWGLFLALGAGALVLHRQIPGNRALPWLTAALVGLLALRVGMLLLDWRRGRLSGTRLLLPAILLAEGLGLAMTGASRTAGAIRLATAALLELSLLALAVRALRQSRAIQAEWPEDRIAAALAAIVPPRAARLMALELVMLGSALRFLFGGFREAAPAGFSHHRDSSLRSFLPALPLLIPADMLLIHALFPHMAPWLRWTLHGSTVYAVLWLFGFYATLKARPHQIRDGFVHLNQGLLKTATFPADLVRSAAPVPEFDDDWARHAHMKGMPKLAAAGPPLLELKLAAPVRIMGLLGPGRPAARLAVSVDDPAAFLAALGQPCA